MRFSLSPLLALLFVLVAPFVGAARVLNTPKVPAIYVFGDSTADVGNNNYLAGSNAKANFPHYGIDFPHSRPTGRFSNGYNGIDFISIQMGYRRSPPAYLSLNESKIYHQILKGHRGVNFASGGSGILDSTGTTITMTKQIEYFSTVKSEMLTRSSSDQVNQLLSKSIFLISSGGNDVFAFFSANSSPNNTAIELFVNSMITNYENHLTKLYNLGARKFAIINVPYIGCVPMSRSNNPTGGCIDGLNQLAKGLNDAIWALFANLSTQLQGMKYSIGSSYDLVSSIIANPSAFGMRDVTDACCGGGKFNAQFSCAPNATLCAKRNAYLFWDAVHPTQATSKLAGLAFYNGPAQFVGPISYKQLVEYA